MCLGDAIGDRIRLLRGRLNLSQDKFADKVRVHHTYISAIERGKQIPSDMLIALMTYEFGVSETWLKTGQGPMMAKPAADWQDLSITESIEQEMPGKSEDKQETARMTEDDPRLAALLNSIRAFWNSSTPEVQSWFKVHFYRTFPEIK